MQLVEVIPSARPEYRKAETHCMPYLKINSTPVAGEIRNQKL
jgi:hypothetical protein